jgi:transcriptional regulator with XRE-family HTH domain
MTSRTEKGPGQSVLSPDQLKPFLDKEYRDAYLDAHVKGTIAYQIQALRAKTGLNQTAFGKLIGKPQSVVSRLENTEYGAVSIQTLLDIAKSLDVGLQVRFSTYYSVLESDVSKTALQVDNIFENYRKLQLETLRGPERPTVSASNTAVLFYVIQNSAVVPGLSVTEGGGPWLKTLQIRQSSTNPRGFATISSGNYIRT